MVFECRNSKIFLVSVLACSVIVAGVTLAVVLPNNEADYTCIMILLRLSQGRKTSKKKPSEKYLYINLRNKNHTHFPGL